MSPASISIRDRASPDAVGSAFPPRSLTGRSLATVGASLTEGAVGPWGRDPCPTTVEVAAWPSSTREEVLAMIRTVSDVMTRTVVVVPTSASVKQVVRAMREHRVSALPVVDAGGAVAGVVSERT